MPGTDGIELVRALARRQIRLPVVLISGHADVPMAVAGIKAGAEDFIEKPVDDAQLVAAINRGLARMSPNSRAAVARERTVGTICPPDAAPGRDLRSGRQGYTSQAIAARLEISTRTVESYRTQMMEKMQAESVAVLVRQAIRLARDPENLPQPLQMARAEIGVGPPRPNVVAADGSRRRKRSMPESSGEHLSTPAEQLLGAICRTSPWRR